MHVKLSLDIYMPDCTVIKSASPTFNHVVASYLQNQTIQTQTVATFSPEMDSSAFL